MSIWEIADLVAYSGAGGGIHHVVSRFTPIHLGGKRNDDYGVADLKATRVIDLDTLNYDRLAGAQAYCVELVTSFALETAYPGANGSPVPWW